LPVDVALEIPAKPDYVGVVRLAVASLARKAGMDEERVDDLKIAVSEACTNAVMDAEEAKVGEPIRVAVHDSGTTMTIEIADSVPASAQAELEDSQGFSTRRTMSAALLASLVDSYEVTPLAEGSVTKLAFDL
jgi:serine/threonine-protein kinase RsbW